MLFTLSTDSEFSLHKEHTESRRLRLADSWTTKPCFSFPAKTFQERVDLPFGMTAQGQDIVKFNSEFMKITCRSEVGSQSGCDVYHIAQYESFEHKRTYQVVAKA